MLFLQQATILQPLLVTQAQFQCLGRVPFLRVQAEKWRAFKVQWLIPHDVPFCLNVDGSSLGNPGNAAGAFVVRDGTGHLLHASSFFVGVETGFAAELEALLRGVRWCKQENITGLHIQTDSQVLVHLLQSPQNWPWAC